MYYAVKPCLPRGSSLSDQGNSATMATYLELAQGVFDLVDDHHARRAYLPARMGLADSASRVRADSQQRLPPEHELIICNDRQIKLSRQVQYSPAPWLGLSRGHSPRDGRPDSTSAPVGWSSQTVQRTHALRQATTCTKPGTLYSLLHEIARQKTTAAVTS
jgi:hypothetical protein